MTWTKLTCRARGTRHTGLSIWFRAGQRGRFHACLTSGAARWFGTPRVSIHINPTRNLVALSPSNDEMDGLVRTYVGKQHFIACTPLIANHPDLLGQSFKLTEATEPGLGRCLTFSLTASQPKPEPPDPEQQSQATLSAIRFDGRQRIATYVTDKLTTGAPVNADHCRAIGNQHHLTNAESTAAMNLAIDQHQSRRPK
jgi:hypothetical protein